MPRLVIAQVLVRKPWGLFSYVCQMQKVKRHRLFRCAACYRGIVCWDVFGIWKWVKRCRVCRSLVTVVEVPDR